MLATRMAYEWRRRGWYRGYVAECPARILVADDDDDLREFVSEALRDDGYEVLEANSGEELLEIIGALLLGEPTASPLELIISDVRMPGGVSGLEMLAGLRRADWSMPVLLMTGYGDEHVYDEASRLGAFVFDKPFDLEDLRTAALNLAPPRV